MGMPPFATSLMTGAEGERAGDVYATQAAALAFGAAYRRGRLGRIASLLRRRPAALVHLATLMDGLTWCGQASAGTQAVLLEHICGSEHRALDFDAAWRPLQTHTRQRWISVARAYGLGIELPPIELIQIGDRYLVRDGHHRVSVARARGQRAIDAQVTVWHISGAVPWQQPDHRPPSVLQRLRGRVRVPQLGRRRSARARPA